MESTSNRIDALTADIWTIQSLSQTKENEKKKKELEKQRKRERGIESEKKKSDTKLRKRLMRIIDLLKIAIRRSEKKKEREKIRRKKRGRVREGIQSTCPTVTQNMFRRK